MQLSLDPSEGLELDQSNIKVTYPEHSEIGNIMTWMWDAQFGETQ